MCDAYEAERRFVSHIESLYPKCDVCKRNTFWHDWRCEGHPDFKEYYKSGMFDPNKVIWKKRPL